jgi:hypothetical protein
MNLVSARKLGAIAKLGIAKRPGSTYQADELEHASAPAEAVDAPAVTHVLPFTPVTVAWRDLEYTVSTPAGPKRLLHGVSGLAVPGRFISLMGVRGCGRPDLSLAERVCSLQASGAGKTTLLDVLACRSTSILSLIFSFSHLHYLQRPQRAQPAAFS